MAWPWQRKHDPVAQEVAEQHARSEQVLKRVERVLSDATHVLDRAKRDAAILDDYQAAEQERTGR